jgi:hypothetical protein
MTHTIIFFVRKGGGLSGQLLGKETLTPVCVGGPNELLYHRRQASPVTKSSRFTYSPGADIKF